VRQRCGPIFDAIAQKVIWLGEAGTGTRMELVINAWLLSLVEGLAETILSPRGSTSIHPRSSRRSRLGRSTIPTPS
jgi:3-hydroxyisobutyrate dehydrogenase-like beta-hydroxyacid dehydrogenase